MPLPRTGPCPFAGSHWPENWVQERFDFQSLSTGQKKDLIEYFYQHESAKEAKQAPNSKPAYRFPLKKLTEYSGIFAHSLRSIVLKSKDYKTHCDEQKRLQAPPPPAELSLLTAALIAACVAAETPNEDAASRKEAGYAWDSAERKSASAAQVVRQADREAAGIKFTDGLPDNDAKYLPGSVTGCVRNKRHDSLDFEKDPHRAMVCNMQKTIEEAVDEVIGDQGCLPPERRDVFTRLVQEALRGFWPDPNAVLFVTSGVLGRLF